MLLVICYLLLSIVLSCVLAPKLMRPMLAGLPDVASTLYCPRSNRTAEYTQKGSLDEATVLNSEDTYIRVNSGLSLGNHSVLSECSS